MKTPRRALDPITPQAYHILAALVASEEAHAYFLRQRIAADSGHSVEMTAATLHHVLARLTASRYLTNEPDQSGRQQYRITATGRQLFEQELKRLERAAMIGKMALQGSIVPF